MSDFEKVLKKAFQDEGYRKRLAKDPHSALQEVGVQPTPEKIAALKSTDDALTNAQHTFSGGGIRPQ